MFCLENFVSNRWLFLKNLLSILEEFCLSGSDLQQVITEVLFFRLFVVVASVLAYHDTQITLSSSCEKCLLFINNKHTNYNQCKKST